MSKALPRTSRLFVVLALGAAACGGGGKSSYPDASSFGSGATTGAAGGAAGSTVGTTGGQSGAATGGTGGSSIVFPGSGGTTTPTGGTSGNSGTPPAVGATSLLAGTALLMGPGLTCSSVPATTTPVPDRWCGVFVPSGNQMVGLLVFNLTQALAGAALTCDTTDANCVPLNAGIDVNANDTDATYGFFGQTLIYYDASTVYAWRPGWTSGRAIMPHSTTSPVQCAAATNDAHNVICLAGSNNNLYAGSLDTPTGGMLPMVESLTNGSTAIDFSPDGQSVIWSVKTTATATNPAETLKMQTIGDATTKKTIATNVTSWAISTDATRWYWLSAPTTDSSMVTTGALQTAPYPAGTAPTAIQGKVGQYLIYGAKSALTLTTAAAMTATGADMNAIADVDAPAPTVVEASDVLGLVGVTSAGNVLYATTAVQPSTSSNSILVDLRLIKVDGTGKCVVTATASADPGGGFNATGTAVEWVQVAVDTTGNATSISGQYTTVADCAPHVFSTSLYAFYDVTSGLVLQQNFDSTSFSADIAYAMFGATGTPGTATVIQPAADSTILPLFPTPGRVLFTLSRGSTNDGVYLSAPITTPDLAPVRLPLATTSPRLLPPTTAKLAQSRFATHSIPSLIAAPAPLSRPSSTPASLPFAHNARTTTPPHLFSIRR